MLLCSVCLSPVEDPRYRRCEKCRKVNREAMARFRARDPERARKYQRGFHEKRRRETIDHYGGKCACCGEDHFEFLTFDHINGGGVKHRLEIGKRGASIVGWLIAQDYPEGFQVLCYNCNSARGYWGRCPHEDE
jgi:hypothetical protein